MNLTIKKYIKNIINNEVYLLCFLASCLSSKKINNLKEICEIYKNLKVSERKIYEIILQAYLFCGFPATIEALKVFNIVFYEYKKPKYRFDIYKYFKTGISTCQKIYRKNFDKLMKNFSELSEEMKEWMIIEGYGKVLGRAGLNLKTRELINISILSTNYYENQLFSHIKGSINTGSKLSEIEKVIKISEYFGGSKNVLKSLKLLNKIKNSYKDKKYC